MAVAVLDHNRIRSNSPDAHGSNVQALPLGPWALASVASTRFVSPVLFAVPCCAVAARSQRLEASRQQLLRDLDALGARHSAQAEQLQLSRAEAEAMRQQAADAARQRCGGAGMGRSRGPWWFSNAPVNERCGEWVTNCIMMHPVRAVHTSPPNGWVAS